MNEEIDIIELLKREKEGKAPEKIEINGTSYLLVPNYKVRGIQNWYSNEINMFYEYWFDNQNISTDTKIKILDKPIIEELEIKKEHKNSTPKLQAPSGRRIYDKKC